MPVASEIDDIFSGKVTKTDVSIDQSLKQSAKKEKASTSNAVTNSDSAPSKKKSKKRKNREREGNDVDAKAPSSTDDAPNNTSRKSKFKGKERSIEHDGDGDEMTKKQKRPRVVETVQDTSSSLGLSKQPKQLPSAATKPFKKKGKEAKDEDIARFMDSRGSGPRKFLLFTAFFHLLC